MGRSIAFIIKHDHRVTADSNANLKLVEQTMKKMTTALHIGLSDKASFTYYDEAQVLCDEITENVSFTLPVYDCEFILHRDFWEVIPGHHYDELFLSYEGSFFLREIAFDVARVLGEEEVWYAEQCYTWDNNIPFDSLSFSLSDWLAFVEQSQGHPLLEFNASEFEDRLTPPKSYEWAYHDSLKDCRASFLQMKDEFRDRGYDLLGLHSFYKNQNSYYRCIDKGQLTLITK